MSIQHCKVEFLGIFLVEFPREGAAFRGHSHDRSGVAAIKKPGNDLLSHRQAAVPSARQGLTSVFGMGTGGSPAPLSPGNILLKGKERTKKKASWAPAASRPWRSSGCRPSTLARRASVGENMVKPHGKLVLVSLMRCRTYTSSLSTWFSPRYLQGDLLPRVASS
jgi:hypothetical protein